MAEEEGRRPPGERLSDLLREWLAHGDLTLALGRRLRQAVEKAVIAELRRRGLWNDGAPRYLGLIGQSWLDPAAPEGGPLAELVSAVLVGAIAERLARWRELLTAPAAHLEGALVKAVRHAIHDLHRHHDPLGYRLYQRAREAVKAAVDEGQLKLAEGASEKIGNTSIFAAPAARPGAPTAGGADPAPPAVLVAKVPEWLDELLPDLVTAVKEKRREVVRRLQQRLAGLAAEGIAVWRFKDLMDPLKAGVRERWRARGRDGGDGELIEEIDDEQVPWLIRILPAGPHSRIEMEHLEKLLDCIAEKLDRHPAQQRTLDHAWSLWGWMRTVTDPDGDPELPSLRELARLLRIPREKIPALRQLFGEFLEACQNLLARPVRPFDFAGGGKAR